MNDSIPRGFCNKGVAITGASTHHRIFTVTGIHIEKVVWFVLISYGLVYCLWNRFTLFFVSLRLFDGYVLHL